jgi:transposase
MDLALLGSILRTVDGMVKQFVLSLIVNQQGIPFFMNTHSGNAPDKITIIEVIKSLKSKLTHENKVYYVTDNSFYTENNIKKWERHSGSVK